METIQTQCSFCHKKFERETRRYNEGVKFHWKIFCSKKCQHSYRDTRKIFVCANQLCQNKILRRNKELGITGDCFCSRSCAATVNNKKYPKRISVFKICKMCGKNYRYNKGYCSRNCKEKDQIIDSHFILQEIKEFYSKNGRIPYKQEFFHSKAARLRFGTWNKAVEAAGFKSNPVRFANKYVANDGHKCDSLAEKIIDDWLNFKKINHLKSPRYPNSKFTSDFKVGDTYIEFFGLTNGLEKYDRLKEEKLAMIDTNNYDLIKIYPKDIFPISKLDKVFTVSLPG